MDEVSRNDKGQAIVRSAAWPYARVATREEELAIKAAVARVGDFETGVQFASFEATIEPDTTNDAANRAAMAVAEEAGK